MGNEESAPMIRKATSRDTRGILDCLHAAFAIYRDNYTPGAFTDTVLTMDTLQQRLDTMCVFVAVRGSGEIAGTIGCQVINPDEGHIRGMAVHPAWQGFGLATQLLNAVESELRERKCSQISLDTTEPLLRAMRFYERNGFRRTGTIADFFGMPMFEYVKILTSKML